MHKGVSAIRGTFFDLIDDPWKHVGHEERAARFYADGLLIIENGKIKAFGSYDDLSERYKDVESVHIRERLILPGFIDGHVHVPQTRVLGSFGEQLLPWLQQWIFPEEIQYKDRDYAKDGTKHFFDNLLAAGTTTCQAFTTVSTVATEEFFEEAARRNMLCIAGLMGLDRFGPPELLDTPDNFYRDSKQLIEKYHLNGRSLYAITPRFALGATHDLMLSCQRLKKEHPDTWVLTHIAEHPTETRLVEELHECSDYLSAYEKYDLVGPKFSGGHGIYLSDDEFKRIASSGAAISFCPVSNLFLGSGLFKLGRATDPENRVRLNFGTDVGGGNRFSMLNVLDEAYKVGMLNNTVLEGVLDHGTTSNAEAERNKLSAYRAFYSITLGGAQSLYLDDRVGNFDIGKEADFVVLDWHAGQKAMVWHQSLMIDQEQPMTVAEAANLLFAIVTIGDDRNVEQTWIMGDRVYCNSK